MDADPWFVGEGDIDAAHELLKARWDAALFLYPGAKHLFADCQPARLRRHRRGTAHAALSRPAGPRGPGPTDPRGGERELLGQYLNFQRETVLAKTAGLNRDQMAQAHEPSSLTLAGLLLHLALVEESWMEKRYLGLPIREPWASIDFDAEPKWEFRTAAEIVPEQLRQRYRETCERGPPPRPRRTGRDQESVKHASRMAGASRCAGCCCTPGETARHAGHADLLREAIDETAGESPAPGSRHACLRIPGRGR